MFYVFSGRISGQRSIQISPKTIYAVAVNSSGFFVAVGYDGYHVHSSDGIN